MHVIYKRIGIVVVAVVMLQSHFDIDSVLHTLGVHDLIVQGVLVLVGVGHELADAAFVMELLFLLESLAFILQGNTEAFSQKGRFLQHMGDGVVVVLCRFEDIAVGFKSDLGTGLGRVADNVEPFDGLSLFKADLVDLFIDKDTDNDPLGQGVDNRSSDTVKTSRNLISSSAEFASGMQDGVDNFNAGNALLGLDIDRDPAAVVDNGDGVVGIDGDSDLGAVAGQSFVDRVVDDFFDQMMKARGRSRADIHTGAFADGFQSFQDLDLAGGVGAVYGQVGLRVFAFMMIVAQFALVLAVGQICLSCFFQKASCFQIFFVQILVDS